MKIIYIIKSLEKGGAERFILNLCKELNKRENIEYKLLILQDGNEYVHLSSEVNYQRLDGPYVPSIFSTNYVNVQQYKDIVDAFKPDIISTHLFRSEIFSTIYLVPDAVYVTHGHDNMVEFENFSFSTLFNKRKLTNFYEKLLLIRNKYQKINKMYYLPNSENTFNYYKRTVPKKFRSNIKLFEPGFHFSTFYKSLSPKNVLLNGKIKILNVGSFVEKKNQAFIIEIAKELKTKNVDFEINLLGDGPNKEKVQQKIVDFGLDREILIRGKVNNVENYLWESDIYLHTAFYEPFGQVLLEAMAAGLPCIVLDGKGNRKLIKNNENGYLFYNQDAEAFVEKIIEYTSNKENYFKLSLNAQSFAKQFDISNKTDELIAFYEKITK
ncbi:MAG: glycosyltransferase [Bacteroidetes bacterium]|nr:glycosyltransferase [Bacteroidota bacterium]